MKRDAIIARLREAKTDLQSRGVHHAALFGSVARGDDSPQSDVDILVDLDAEVVRTIYDYVGVKHLIADIVGGAVDVVDRQNLRARVAPGARADEIRAF